jgi:enoyl-CoA hydratase/carnithine racemase
MAVDEETMIGYAVEGPIARAALDRPDKLNAMHRGFWVELRELVRRIEEDDAVRALVVHGEGPCFSVGGDIAGFGELQGSADRRKYVGEALGAFRAFDRCTKPTIAAVHGHALGGGCELTIVCDIVVADETARFGTPEAQVGLVPGLGVARGGVQMNLHWLKYLVLTGETLTAEQAQLAGLVNIVTPAGQHLAEADRLANLIAQRAPLALEVGKEILGSQADEDYDHAADAVAFLQGTEDAAEGIAAFKERRRPTFEGN